MTKQSNWPIDHFKINANYCARLSLTWKKGLRLPLMWKKRLSSWNNQHHQLLCFVMEGKNGHRRFWLKGDEIQQFRFMLQSLLTSAITCLQPMDNPTSTNLFNVIYKILEISQCEVLFSHGIYKWPYIFKTKDRHLNLQDQNGKDKKYQKVKAQRPKSWSKTLQAV